MQILTVDYQSPHASLQLAESLHNTGFAVLTNHPLCWEEIECSYQEWQVFFNSEYKHRYQFNPDKQDGYLSKTHHHQAANSKIGKRDIKEVFQLYFPWGQYPQEVSDLPKKLFKQKFELGKRLLGWVEKHLPNDTRANLKEHLTDIVSLERTLYRAIHYPPLSGEEEPGSVRAAAHEDFDLLTLLPAATESGLQVQDKEGKWHEVGVDPKTIVINAGGTLQEATNYYYKSTVHRVVNPTGEKTKRARLSLPIFLHARRDAYLSPRYLTVGEYFDEQINLLQLDKY